MRTKIIATTLLVVFLLQGSLFAQATNTTTNKQGDQTKKSKDFGRDIGKAMDRYRNDQPSEGGGGGGLGRFVEAILVLTLFVVGIYGVFRFIQRKRGTTGSGETTIHILSSLSLGGSRMLQIVEVGNKVYFLGVADAAINLIAEITDKETLDWVRMEASRVTAAGKEGFLERLYTLLGKGEEADSEKQSREKVEYLRKQKDRLSRMRDKK